MDSRHSTLFWVLVLKGQHQDTAYNNPNASRSAASPVFHICIIYITALNYLHWSLHCRSAPRRYFTVSASHNWHKCSTHKVLLYILLQRGIIYPHHPMQLDTYSFHSGLGALLYFHQECLEHVTNQSGFYRHFSMWWWMKTKYIFTSCKTCRWPVFIGKGHCAHENATPLFSKLPLCFLVAKSMKSNYCEGILADCFANRRALPLP